MTRNSKQNEAFRESAVGASRVLLMLNPPWSALRKPIFVDRVKERRVLPLQGGKAVRRLTELRSMPNSGGNAGYQVTRPFVFTKGLFYFAELKVGLCPPQTVDKPLKC